MQWLNAYLGPLLGVCISEGRAGELSVQIESYVDGRGEFCINNLQLIVRARSEEGLVFYDALDSSVVYAAPPLAPLDQLARDISVADLGLDGYDGDPDSAAASTPAKLLSSALHSFFERFTVTCRNVVIQVVGAQRFHRLVVTIPQLEVYQPRGFHELSLDLAQGIHVELDEGDQPRTLLLRLADHASLSIPLPGDGTLSSPLQVLLKCRQLDLNLPASVLPILREFLLTYGGGGALWGRESLATPLASGSRGPAASLNCQIASVVGQLGPLHLVLQDALLTMDAASHRRQIRWARATMAHRSGESEAGDNDTLEALAVTASWGGSLGAAGFTCDSLNIRSSQPLSWLQAIQDCMTPLMGRDGDLFASASAPISAGGSGAMGLDGKISTVNVLLRGLPGEASLTLDGLEINARADRLALHCESGQLQVDSNRLLLARASLYVSRRQGERPSSAGAAPHPKVWPFSDLTKVLEGRRVVATMDSPEDYFIFRSRVLETALCHWHVSAESVRIRGDWSSLRDSLGSLLSTVGGGGGGALAWPAGRFLSASIGQLEICESRLGLALEVAAVELLGGETEGGEGQCGFLDVRCDYNSLSWSPSEDQRYFLLQKILVVSLDPHFKSLVLTMHRQQPPDRDDGSAAAVPIETIISLGIYGALITLPVLSPPFGALTASLWRAYQGVADEVVEGRGTGRAFYLNANLCSLRLQLPIRYEVAMPPHTAYLETARLLYTPTDCVAFLQQGEIFMAPSVKHTRPVTGLFGEGHNYWEEQNYAPIGRFDFIMVSLEREDEGGAEVHAGRKEGESARNNSGSGGGATLRLEDNMILLDLYADSTSAILHCINLYLRMIREQRLAESTALCAASTKNPSQVPLEAEAFDYGVGVLFSPKEEEGEDSRGDPLGIDDDFYSPETMQNLGTIDDPNGKGDDGLWGGLEQLIELELDDTTSEEHPTAEGASVAPEQLEIDEDFFSQRLLEGKDKFPFRLDRAGVKRRLQIKDFSLRVRLLEGRRWYPVGAANSSGSHPTALPTTDPLSSSTASVDGLPITGLPLGRTVSQLSSSAASSSRWSHLMPPPGPREGGAESSSSTWSLPAQDSVEIVCSGVNAELDWSIPFPSHLDGPGLDEAFLTAIRLTSRSVEVIDRVRSSRWKSLVARRVIRGDSSALPVFKFELDSFFVEKEEEGPVDDADDDDDAATEGRTHQRPTCSLPEDQLESTVEIQVEPLRVHVDQDTLLFLVRFGEALLSGQQRATAATGEKEAALRRLARPVFLQRFRLSELSIRMDYKPKKVSIKRAMGGNYFEFLNIFDLEDADLHLPAVTLTGISGMEGLLARLLRAWMPYVRNTQIPQVVGGIAPVKTVRNLGGGLTDLVLLPIEQYRKNGRIVHGLRKGTTSFLHSTTLELARIGARLAVGAQTLLEHADDIVENDPAREEERVERRLGIATTSKYSSPPADLGEGVFSALHSIKDGLQGAAETIIAVPVQVYERRGPGGAAKAVLRAIPVAVLRTAMGASEAVGKALIGMESSLDPARGVEIKQKYKSRHDRYSLAASAEEELPSPPPCSTSLDGLGSASLPFPPSSK